MLTRFWTTPVVALLVSAAIAPTASGAATTGTIKLTVTDPVGQPIAGWLICPSTRVRGSNKAGGCGITDAGGHVTLRHVKAGVVYVSRFVGPTAEVPDTRRIAVKAGRTTQTRWTNAGS